MPVVVPPPPRNLLLQIAKPLFGLACLAALVVFLVYRFGATPLEKAEKLFQARDLVALRNFSEKKLESTDSRQLFYAYYAVAEFSVNKSTHLASLLNNIRAVDERVIFRRDALARILQIEQNHKRLGEILTELIKLEEKPGPEVQALMKQVLSSAQPLESSSENFTMLVKLFPQDVWHVAARKLQFRSSASTDSEILRQLDEGEPLLQRSRSHSTLVSGKRGHWLYAVDSNMQSGWVFDAYLKHQSKR